MKDFDFLSPLLIPSFSSKGSLFLYKDNNTVVSDNYDLLNILAIQVCKAYLLSAYDIYYGYLPTNPDEWPDVEYLFLDSGGYEISDSFETSERNKYNYKVNAWDETKMCEVYRNAVSCRKFKNSKIVLSTYDLTGPFETQLNAAIEMVNTFPDACINFIIRISFPFEDLLSGIKRNIDSIQKISIIGLTEKELGDTVRQRLINLITLKELLIESNWNGSIHIFGGLDPNLSILYYVAGADIFDGLSWQRIRYSQNSSLYNPEEYNITWNEHENKLMMMYNNLAFLNQLSVFLSCEFDNCDAKRQKLKASLNENSTIRDLLNILEV